MEEEYRKRFGTSPSFKAACTHSSAACKTTTHPLHTLAHVAANQPVTLPPHSNVERSLLPSYNPSVNFYTHRDMYESGGNTSTFSFPATSIQTRFRSAATSTALAAQNTTSVQVMAPMRTKRVPENMPNPRRNPCTVNISLAMPGNIAFTIKYRPDELKDIGIRCQKAPLSSSLLQSILEYEDSRESQSESLFFHKVISTALEESEDEQEVRPKILPTLMAKPIQLQQPGPPLPTISRPVNTRFGTSTRSARPFIPAYTPQSIPAIRPLSVLGLPPGPQPTTSIPAQLASSPSTDPLKVELERLIGIYRVSEARWLALQKLTTNLFSTLPENNETASYAAQLLPLIVENARIQPLEPTASEFDVQVEIEAIKRLAPEQTSPYAFTAILKEAYTSLLVEKRKWHSHARSLTSSKAEQETRLDALEARITALEKHFTSSESARMRTL